MKMTEELAKNGLFFDYLYNLRVLDPNIASETNDLKDKSGEYTDSKRKSHFFFSEILKFISFFFIDSIRSCR